MSQELVRPNGLCRQCMKWKGTPYSILDMHPIAGESQTAKQNEGVGIILDPQMTTAWKEAGKIWKAVSSWIVTARIKIARQDGAMPDRWSSRGALFINVISVYVPINPPSCPREGVLRSSLRNHWQGVHGRFVVGWRLQCQRWKQWETKSFNKGRSERIPWCWEDEGERRSPFCTLNELTFMKHGWRRSISTHSNIQVAGIATSSTMWWWDRIRGCFAVISLLSAVQNTGLITNSWQQCCN